MVTRRMFLVGVWASALMLGPASAVPTPEVTRVASAQNPAMDILIDVVRDFLEHIDAFGGPKQHRGAVKCMYHEWRDIKGEALEAKIIETMRHIYSNPLFAEVSAKNGSILDEDGRMNPFVQLLFPASLPMNLQYAGNPRVFQAFASFAPAHLL